VLRPLEHEVPPQVRKANESWALLIRLRGLGFRRYWHPDASKHFSYILLVELGREKNGQQASRVPQQRPRLTQNISLLQCNIRQNARLTG
jgi:hypothetical protein